MLFLKRVLVTGAYGFIGRYTARAYHSEGFYVIGLGHGTWSISEARAWGVDEWHNADVNMDSLQSYASDVSIIVHIMYSNIFACFLHRHVCYIHQVQPFMEIKKHSL